MGDWCGVCVFLAWVGMYRLLFFVVVLGDYI